jgi:tRNA-splicing ligase RtcB (3'-phosphate/5'-hydroxy nucleic acid ligase)
LVRVFTFMQANSTMKNNFNIIFNCAKTLRSKFSLCTIIQQKQKMETIIEAITAQELINLGITHEAAHAKFLRVTDGLTTKGNYTPQQALAYLAEMLHHPKKFAFSKNKLNSLAKYVMALATEGISIMPSDYAKSLVEQNVVEKATKQTAVFELSRLDTQGSYDFELKQNPDTYKIYGARHIEQGALTQMDTAMKLPISVAGALMPDAHQGYGLPIGGVLATRENTIIPFAVGVDIACRMCMTVFDLPPHLLKSEEKRLKGMLMEHTFFGIGSETRGIFDDSVFEQPEWSATPLIKKLRDKAYRQLGTSGTGNHFVEWGELEVMEVDDLLGLPQGKYLALLSHSGSRGFGGNIADYYSKVAMQKTRLPNEAKHLAWLNLDSQEGQEYWIAMNLAGDYASANHHEIHNKIAKAMKHKPLKRIENHHNFAWKEQLADGTPVMVHRKGATPAGANDLGIIPASMTQPGFVVRGKGEPHGINSASHGAGRLMSRSAAFKAVTRKDIKDALEKAGVVLIGADIDEAPQVYKDINMVLAAQTALVSVLAKFSPKMVRMADAKERSED